MYKRFLIAIIAVITVLTAVAQKHIYLAPNGNDNNIGTIDEPMLSLQAAIDAAISTTEKDTAYIEVAAGDYYTDKCCVLKKPNTRPIIIRGEKGNKPRFIGGKKISKWTRSGGMFRAAIPEAVDNDYTFEQFYIDGRRATFARTPNKGFFSVKNATEVITDSGKNITETFATIRIEGNEKEMDILKDIWAGENREAKVSLYHKWDNSKMHIDVINREKKSFNISGRRIISHNSIDKATKFFLYDFTHALDTIGEWYMNYADGYIYYIPLPGENMEKAECIIPTLTKWIYFNGSADNFIENISFINIIFYVSKFNLPRAGYISDQAASNLGASIELSYTKNISFIGCEFEKSGTHALWMKRECYNSRVERCFFNDIGAGAIKIGLPIYEPARPITSNNIIDNNIIKGGGKEFAAAAAITIYYSKENSITHNDISDYRYSGISLGWKWGYGENPINNNTIAYNHIHHLGWGEMSDLGGIYTLGESTGNSIVGNVIHDIASNRYGGWGIYTDEGSSNILIKNNLVYRCHDGAFHQHYGKENIIENNIFAFGNNNQIQVSRPEAHSSFTFKHNIILQSRGFTARGLWFDAKMDIEKNLYWNYDGGFSFCGKDENSWKAEREPSAYFADPRMNDPINDDFTFKSKKAIKKIKFKPFDYSNAGVYGDKEWRIKADESMLIHEEFIRATGTK